MTEEQELNRLKAAAQSHKDVIDNLMGGTCVRILEDGAFCPTAVYGVKISMESIQDLKACGLDPQVLHDKYVELVRDALEQTFDNIMAEVWPKA